MMPWLLGRESKDTKGTFQELMLGNENRGRWHRGGGGGTWSWGQSHMTRGKAQVTRGGGEGGVQQGERLGREVGLKGRGGKGRRGKREFCRELDPG
jgi:hypothetical protein